MGKFGRGRGRVPDRLCAGGGARSPGAKVRRCLHGGAGPRVLCHIGSCVHCDPAVWRSPLEGEGSRTPGRTTAVRMCVPARTHEPMAARCGRRTRRTCAPAVRPPAITAICASRRSGKRDEWNGRGREGIAWRGRGVGVRGWAGRRGRRARGRRRKPASSVRVSRTPKLPLSNRLQGQVCASSIHSKVHAAVEGPLAMRLKQRHEGPGKPARQIRVRFDTLHSLL